MQRTTKLRITTTHKRTIKISISAHRAFCADCRQEVQVLTRQQAAELLEASQQRLEMLIAAGKLHAVSLASGDLWICKDSLFS